MLVMLLKGRASFYHGPKRPITIFEAIFPKMKCFLFSRFGSRLYFVEGQKILFIFFSCVCQKDLWAAPPLRCIRQSSEAITLHGTLTPDFQFDPKKRGEKKLQKPRKFENDKLRHRDHGQGWKSKHRNLVPF